MTIFVSSSIDESVELFTFEINNGTKNGLK